MATIGTFTLDRDGSLKGQIKDPQPQRRGLAVFR